MCDTMTVVRTDFAGANQRVCHGMGTALVLAFLCALWQPGGRVTGAPRPEPGPAPAP